MCVLSPVRVFSVVTLTPTSSDVLNTRFTEARRTTTSPCFTGLRKFSSSTEAVTHTRFV